MKNRYFFFVISILLVTSNHFIFSQEKTSNVDVALNVDFVSRYNWRGINLSNSSAIQPTLEFSCKNITLGSWASYTTALESMQEVDFYAKYSKGPVTLTLYDYFNPIEGGASSPNYFNYSSDSTLHTIEAIAETEPFGKFPLSATVGVFIYGNDRDTVTGKNQYSTYLQLAYPFNIQKSEINLFCGVTPAKGYYANKFNVVNVGLSVARDIEITDNFKVPITGTLGVNPELKNIYFVVGLTL